MRKSKYPQYFGAGVAHFIYWCRCVKAWSHYPNKKLYREQVRYWLDIDAPDGMPKS